MARRTKAEAEQTRLKIMKAALDLFVEKGYARTTFEDVARRIGLSKGAVYWHFKNKSALLIELVIHMTRAHTDEEGRVLTDPVSLEDLRAYFVARADFVLNRPMNRKFFHMMTRLDWSAAKFAAVKKRLQQLETGVFAVIERTLNNVQRQGGVRVGVDVPAVAAILGALWLGLIKVHQDKCLGTDLLQTIALGFDMVIDTIRT